MKKILSITVALLLMSSSAFALGQGVDQLGTFSVGGTNTGNPSLPAPTLSCGLSSKVHAIYYTDGTGPAPAQWYSIGTYHLGGTDVYATAQDITGLYKLRLGKVPGNLFEWAGMPEDSTASATWSAGLWTAM
jgi:hypothetical protein